ncbi:MAG: hypothetical protein ACI9QN_002714 [Arcticibacterium sp.]|jgi:hypothetical protein
MAVSVLRQFLREKLDNTSVRDIPRKSADIMEYMLLIAVQDHSSQEALKALHWP